MRLLFLTDTHIRTASMRSRLDTILDTLEEKLREVAAQAREYHVDAVIHGGDLFDRPDVSVQTVARFATLLADFPVPIYVVAGNHDIFAHNPKTLPRTMLGLLSALHVIHLIPEEGMLLENDCKVQLTAAPFRYDIDRGERIAYCPQRNTLADWHIHVVHGMLLPKPFIADISHTVIADLPKIEADVVLSGHYHNGYDTIESKGTLFVNPGSLLRTSNSKIDMLRTPQTVLLSLSKEMTLTHLPLRCAKPGEEVLSRAAITEIEMRQENLEQFKLLVREHVDLERYDIFHMLEEVSQKEEFEPAIVQEAIRRLAMTEGLFDKEN